MAKAALRHVAFRTLWLEAADYPVLLGSADGRLILGPELIQFEEAIAAYCGRRYCIGVNSGT